MREEREEIERAMENSIVRHQGQNNTKDGSSSLSRRGWVHCPPGGGGRADSSVTSIPIPLEAFSLLVLSLFNARALRHIGWRLDDVVLSQRDSWKDCVQLCRVSHDDQQLGEVTADAALQQLPELPTLDQRGPPAGVALSDQLQLSAIALWTSVFIKQMTVRLPGNAVLTILDWICTKKTSYKHSVTFSSVSTFSTSSPYIHSLLPLLPPALLYLLHSTLLPLRVERSVRNRQSVSTVGAVNRNGDSEHSHPAGLLLKTKHFLQHNGGTGQIWQTGGSKDQMF
ncbi:hypothetical protein GBAR_LOCUS10553 [Geodia barretti]|uniref:Uncharacterized protein n=1 Tax=Geodia barretti TaxID=519541 RepID=A0AA35WKR1_GEOBA|nr:hypothetical protein GBAR_LOCUS10553 [Geodia barretti]